MRHPIIFSLLFIIFVTAATAIKCYQCDSMSDKLCHYAPKHANNALIECNEAAMPEYLAKYDITMAATGCMTKITKGVGDDALFVRRSCYFGDLERTEAICHIPDSYLPYRDILECIVCATPECNTNNADQTQKLNLLFGLILGTIVLFLK